MLHNLYPSHCVFQDLRTGPKIGRGSERNGLYTLDLKKILTELRTKAVVENKVSLWHRCLGHSPPRCLENIPFLNFANKPNSKFKCNECQFANNKRSVH